MQQWKSWGPSVIRLVLGVTFIYMGWGKLTDAYSWLFGGQQFGFAGMVSFMPLLPAWLWGLAAMLAEFLGGICVLLGYKVRVAGFFISIVMIVAILGVKLPGPGLFEARLDFALLAMAVSLILTGAGKLAVEPS